MLARIFAVAMIATTAAAQAPPVEFKGVPMGATRAELLERMPDFKCYASGCALDPDDVRRRECPNLSISVDCLKRVKELTGFGPASVTMWTVTFRDERIATTRITMGTPWFGQVVIALTEKYGQPQTDATTTIQNRAGASFSNRKVGWTLPTGTIRGEERSGVIDKASFTLAAPGAEAAETKEFVDKAKATAKSL